MEKIGKVKSIWIYPIKSLDGTKIDESKFNNSGGLNYDRKYALKDISGEYINAKNYPEIIKIRSKYHLKNHTIELSQGDSYLKFSLKNEKTLIEEWFSDYINKKVQLHENLDIGFPDDRKRPGPTVYSTESIQKVCEWFPELRIEEIRRRFRGNIELTSEKPGFWEDDLLNSELIPGRFQIENVAFKAIKPCPRCPVPSRDSLTSEVYTGFQKRFTKMRGSLSSNNNSKALYPHHYMFALNTTVSNPENARINVGAGVKVDD